MIPAGANAKFLDEKQDFLPLAITEVTLKSATDAKLSTSLIKSDFFKQMVIISAF